MRMLKPPIASKITSEAALAEVLSGPRMDVLRLRFSSNVGCPRIVGGVHVSADAMPWWVAREEERLRVGAYVRTVLLNSLARWPAACPPQHFIHCSESAPEHVAYTASAQDGANDKQKHCALSAYLKKYATFLSDGVVAQLEAAHLAELRGAYKVATTEEDIFRVYTQMKNDSGCMRYKSPTAYSALADWENAPHPSAAYCAPGFGVAYIEADSVTARCVIWDNPADPSDKRWVRVYGEDGARLKHALTRAGYREAGLAGAKLKTIEVEGASDGLFVMPYIDTPQQEDKCKVIGAVLNCGEVTLLGGDVGEHVRGLSGPCATTAGAVRLLPVHFPDFVSHYTGKMHNGLNYEAVAVVMEGVVCVGGVNGTPVAFATANEVKARGSESLRTVFADTTPGLVSVPVETKRFTTLGRGGAEKRWVDTPVNRRANGFVATSSRYSQYGEWLRADIAAEILTLDYTTAYVPRQFAATRHDLLGAVKVARCDIDEWKARGFLSVTHSYSGLVELVHKDHPKLCFTPDGEAVFHGVNSALFGRDYKGALRANSSMSRKLFGEVAIWVCDKETVSGECLVDFIFANALPNHTSDDLPDRAIAIFFRTELGLRSDFVAEGWSELRDYLTSTTDPTVTHRERMLEIMDYADKKFEPLRSQHNKSLRIALGQCVLL